MRKLLKFLDKHAVLLILFFPFVLHFNGLFNGFALDDFDHVVNNPVVHRISNFFNIFLGGAFYRGDQTQLSGNFYRPLMLEFFALTHFLFKANPFFYHLLSIMFQSINAFLIFTLFVRFFPRLTSLIVVILFLSHPINSEVVSNVAHFQELLYLTFGLLAIIFTLSLKSEFKVRDFTILTIFLLLALFSKESAVIFVLLTVAISLVFKNANRSLIMAPIASVGTYLFIRLVIAKVGLFHTSITPIMRADIATRLITIPKIITHYMLLTFFPRNLSIGQHWLVKQINFADFFLPILVIAVSTLGVVTLVYFLWKKEDFVKRTFIFFLIWFLLSIGFHIQIFPIEYTVAERWLYIPLVGLLGMVAAVVHALDRQKQLAMGVLAIIFIVGFSVRTFVRNFDWKNNFTIAQSDIKVNKDSFELEALYGSELLSIKKYQEAHDHLLRSVELNPYWVNIHNLGVSYLALGQRDKALEHFNQAAKEYKFFKSYENLASLYLAAGDLDKTKEVLEEALKIYPRNTKLWFIMIGYQEKVGNLSEAEKAKKIYQQLKSGNSPKFDSI